MANPTVDLQVSGDNGAAWNTIATGLTMDGYGRGSYNWTVPANQPPGQYLMRVVSDDFAGVSGTSAGTFQIANGGTSFYVNGDSTAGDQYTTAVGNNLNDGKTPSTPMASLAALINVYHPGAGDTIYVDNGTYDLSSNIVLTAADSGLTIVGPTDPGTAAVLNRGNGNSGAYAIDLNGANDVTLDNLSVTGAYDGIVTYNNSGLTVTDSSLYGNSYYGIYVDGSSSGVTLADSSVDGNGLTGICINGSGATVIADTVYANGGSYVEHCDGIDAYGWADTISDNNVYGNYNEGIVVNNGDWNAGCQSVVSGNTVDNNLWGGSSNEIDATSNVLVTGNTVYGNGGRTGIFVTNGATASDNVVYGNYDGIVGGSSASVIDNRSFANTDAGIVVNYWGGCVISGNTVYSNSIGIYTIFPGWVGTVTNNLIYANTNEGVLISGGGGQLINNTIYQPVGDAVKVQDGSQNVDLENNILWVQAGYDINVAPDSEVGFSSDYNDLYTTNTGQIALWEGQSFTNLADWFYEVGFDGHSITANPQFIDPAGTDGILGLQHRV